MADQTSVAGNVLDVSDAVELGVPGHTVSWDLAERVAGWIGNRKPLPEGYRPDELQREFDELTAEAEELVAQSTGLRSPTGLARSRVTDRSGWVHANVASFQRLVGPHLDRLDPGSRLVASNPLLNRFAGPLASAGRALTGTQMGVVLGWLSTRVLGQYDLLLTEEAVEDQDIVYFVGPNVVALEQRHGFEPHEFRLWLALHEVTHRCQFTAIPWMRDHFLSLVNQGLGSLDPDPSRFAEVLRRMTEEIRAGRNPLRDNGALGLVATPEQLEGLHRIQALMSLLEGHGDVTMDRAGAARDPQCRATSARCCGNVGARPVARPGSCSSWWGWRPSSASTRKGSGSSPLWRPPVVPSSWTGHGGGRSGSRR